jgi:hypothetical protein
MQWRRMHKMHTVPLPPFAIKDVLETVFIDRTTSPRFFLAVHISSTARNDAVSVIARPD